MGEEKKEIVAHEEVLFRQVHPQFFAGGRISSQVFEAPRSHKGLLSVDRESLTTAKNAFTLFTTGFGLSSACVCGVSVGEVKQQGLQAFSDPIDETEEHPANPAHATIDMSSYGRSKMKKMASRLAQFARGRGILYQPA